MLSSSPLLAMVSIAASILWIILLVSIFRDGATSVGGSADIEVGLKADHSIESKPTQNLHRSLQTEELIAEPKRYHTMETPLEPPPLSEIAKNMTLYLNTLHKELAVLSGPHSDAQKTWETFFDVTRRMPMQWDEENKHRYFVPRKDNSIYVLLVTYRDPYCPMTIKSLYSMAKYPERLFVSLFQQNCFEKKCRTGVLVGGVVNDADTDVDCYIEFCKSPEGQRSNACNTGQVRLFNVNESESLGPYMARYLGAKWYRGEQYYLQIDSHSEFVQDWDDKLIKMVEDAPAKKPVISTYPPSETVMWKNSVGYRICDSEFASAQIEWQIVRLGVGMQFDFLKSDIPRYAPFVAAGFFFGSAELLREVPFDPLLPWIFMGEEISMSARLWTAGYDIFSPTINVLNHYYVRRHYPKFWESVNRFFKNPALHNNVMELILKRVKCMLGYPESHPDLIFPKSVLYRLEDWSMGTKRSFDQYMKMVGLDTLTKKVTVNQWCHRGEWPEEAKQYYFDKKNLPKK